MLPIAILKAQGQLQYHEQPINHFREERGVRSPPGNSERLPANGFTAIPRRFSVPAGFFPSCDPASTCGIPWHPDTAVSQGVKKHPPGIRVTGIPCMFPTGISAGIPTATRNLGYLHSGKPTQSDGILSSRIRVGAHGIPWDAPRELPWDPAGIFEGIPSRPHGMPWLLGITHGIPWIPPRVPWIPVGRPTGSRRSPMGSRGSLVGSRGFSRAFPGSHGKSQIMAMTGDGSFFFPLWLLEFEPL